MELELRVFIDASMVNSGSGCFKSLTTLFDGEVEQRVVRSRRRRESSLLHFVVRPTA
jgi:hypothetical protein